MDSPLIKWLGLGRGIEVNSGIDCEWPIIVCVLFGEYGLVVTMI